MRAWAAHFGRRLSCVVRGRRRARREGACDPGVAGPAGAVIPECTTLLRVGGRAVPWGAPRSSFAGEP